MIASRHLVIGNAPERVILDLPAAEAIVAEAKRVGARRVVLAASRSLGAETDEIAQVTAALGDRMAALLPPIRAHAPKSDLAAATQVALDADADLIVAIGGSSIMDGAKIVALAHAHRAVTPEALDALRVQYNAQGQIVRAPAKGPDLRLVCVPTTLSGGEFNTLSGAYDETLGQKHGFQHPGMMPMAAVLDPLIARHTPERLWLATGVRAVDHAVETLVSPYSNAYYDGLAAAGLSLLVDALPRLKADPADRAARFASQVGAWQAAVPLVGGVPMGASHAIGHALGAFGIAHGETSCVMAASVQRWNAEESCPAQRRIARIFGDETAPLDDLLHTFIGALGLPRSLGEIGIDRQVYPRLAELTLADIWGGTNARPLRNAHDVMAILRLAER
ncbi:MAG: iron-containing alcohol dehydrogenase [Novosphingobium sp.]